jgi:hypothetical protein
VNLKQLAYLLVCGAAVLYLVSANARGYVPFAAPLLHSAGGYSNNGGYFLFHK